MRVWDAKAVVSVGVFLSQVRKTQQGEDVLIEFHVDNMADHLVYWHQKHFAWHHNDTIRSYTEMALRKRGNHGKRTDFSYMNRAACYFGYDQFAEHRVQKNKLICLWDPSLDGDYFGEHNPCLVLVKFFEDGKHLDMRVVFRKRDLLKRMIGNWAMLARWFRMEAKARKKQPRCVSEYSMETMYDKAELEKLMYGE